MGFCPRRPHHYTGPGGVFCSFSLPRPCSGPSHTHCLDGPPFFTTKIYGGLSRAWLGWRLGQGWGGEKGNNIGKNTALRPVASCSPCPPDVPGAYNVNSSSGCFRPGSFRPGAAFFRPDALGAPWRSLPSNHTPSAKPLPPAAPEAPVRLPPPPEAFRL